MYRERLAMIGQEKAANGMGRGVSIICQLTLLVGWRNLGTAKFQDKHSLTHKPPYLARAFRFVSVAIVRSESDSSTRDAGESGLLNSGRN